MNVGGEGASHGDVADTGVVRSSKKEEFEHLESLIRNEKKIQMQHRKERVEQEYDHRKECLRSYTDL